MTEIIAIRSVGGIEAVNARELHEKLQVGRDFSTWIKDRVEKYGFIEGQDFIIESRSPIPGTGNRGASLEYHLSIDMAKELAMVENNEQGRLIRRYFIEVEKTMRSIGRIPHELGKLEASLAMSFNLLRPAESSKIAIMRRVYQAYGLDTLALPDYTDGQEVRSATVLLKAHNAPISAREFNQMMLAAGLLETKTRPSRGSGVAKYWSLTDKGLEYGKNLVSDQNQRETQPLYFEVKFPALLRVLGVQ